MRSLFIKGVENDIRLICKNNIILTFYWNNISTIFQEITNRFYDIPLKHHYV